MIQEIIQAVLDPVTLIRPIVQNPWLVYPVLWALVAFESAFVLFAWLPGETSMFIAGSLAAQTAIPINIFVLWLGYLPAAYFGWQFKKSMGTRHRHAGDSRVDDTMAFFTNHAPLALVFGRYIPIFGIFIPVVAGEAAYSAGLFKRYNAIGAVLWVVGSTSIGFFLGNVPFFKQHFTILLAAIIIVPTVLYYVANYLNAFFRHSSV
jgi:membrane-associated protein